MLTVTTFSVTVPLKVNIFLLGDNRIVSKIAEAVGFFDKSALVGVKFRWPLNKIGTVEEQLKH